MTEKLPTHIAIVPDGNRRWSKEHGVPALEGHRRGAEAMHNVVDYLIGRVQYLTVWGFSSDNWKRSGGEVNNLFYLLATWIENDTPWLNSRGVRLRYIGRLHELPERLQRAINQAVERTRYNGNMRLNLAFNYSGRVELVDAIRRLIDEGVPSELVDEKLISNYLYTRDTPDVDLLIRTGSEQRVSNFLLWQSAYSELYFTPVFWPDFDKVEVERALNAYATRERRFGE